MTYGRTLGVLALAAVVAADTEFMIFASMGLLLIVTVFLFVFPFSTATNCGHFGISTSGRCSQMADCSVLWVRIARRIRLARTIEPLSRSSTGNRLEARSPDRM